jgi:hypothetical protein
MRARKTVVIVSSTIILTYDSNHFWKFDDTYFKQENLTDENLNIKLKTKFRKMLLRKDYNRIKDREIIYRKE